MQLLNQLHEHTFQHCSPCAEPVVTVATSLDDTILVIDPSVELTS